MAIVRVLFILMLLVSAGNLAQLMLAWVASGHDGWWRIDFVYGNNIFDNQYVKGLNTYGRGPLGVVGATISEPRTYGMEVAVKF